MSTPKVDIIDCHAHIIDAARWPYAAGKGYFPGPDEQGDAAAYGGVLAAHGIDRALLVQPSAYATDNRAMLEAIELADGRFRGIAVLSETASAAEMASLSGDGIVGLRLNVASFDPDFFERSTADRFIDAAIAAGLFVEVYAVASTWRSIAPQVSRPGLKLIIDHFGHPRTNEGVASPDFRSVLDLAELPQAIIKLSSAFRVSEAGPPYGDVDPFVAEAIAAFGIERCIWGSDWPFVAHEGAVTLSDQLSLVDRWLPSAADREKVLSENPRRLFFEDDAA